MSSGVRSEAVAEYATDGETAKLTGGQLDERGDPETDVANSEVVESNPVDKDPTVVEGESVIRVKPSAASVIEIGFVDDVAVVNCEPNPGQLPRSKAVPEPVKPLLFSGVYPVALADPTVLTARRRCFRSNRDFNSCDRSSSVITHPFSMPMSLHLRNRQN